MDGLELLGVVDTAIAKEFITLRIKSIDREKLRNALGGSSGTLAASAMPFVNLAPIAALSAVAPIIVSKAKDYGVEMDVMVSGVDPKRVSAISEFFPGLIFGIGIGGAGLVIVKLLGRLFRR